MEIMIVTRVYQRGEVISPWMLAYTEGSDWVVWMGVRSIYNAHVSCCNLRPTRSRIGSYILVSGRAVSSHPWPILHSRVPCRSRWQDARDTFSNDPSFLLARFHDEVDRLQGIDEGVDEGIDA